MKRAGFVKLLEDDGHTFGFMLGPDFCAEHEIGIKDLEWTLGIGQDPKAMGLARRTAAATPPERAVLMNEFSYRNHALGQDGKRRKTMKGLALVVDRRHTWMEPQKDPEYFKHLTGRFANPVEGEDATAAWDGGSFAIFAYTDRARAALTRLYEGLQAGDFAAWIGGAPPSNPFSRSGLIVAIASLVPEEGAKVMLDADLERERLRKAAAKTGIESRLKEAGKRYFALSPKFRQPDDGRTSDHPVHFWLNPVDQSNNNYGWFTVEELDDWIEGRGPIPMRPQPEPPAPR